MAYLEQRDYRDAKGDIHDSESGQYVAEAKANDGEYELKEEHIPHNEKSTKRLVEDWAEAEDNSDKNKRSDIQDELYTRIEAATSVPQKLSSLDLLTNSMVT